MEEYIKKSALVVEIERLKNTSLEYGYNTMQRILADSGKDLSLGQLQNFIDTLEVKEVDEQKERMSECPYRQVGCTMYDGNIFECKGACNWVMDYLKLKGLEEQKESKV